MSANQEYIKPPVTPVPPLFVFRVASWLSTGVLLGGFFVLYKILSWDFSDEQYTCSSTYYDGFTPSCTSGYSLWHWLVPVILGVLLLWLFSHLKYYYYREVQQGEVVDKNFSIINGWSSHQLKLYGYNRAGQMTYNWRSVWSSTYEKYNEGDFVRIK